MVAQFLVAVTAHHAGFQPCRQLEVELRVVEGGIARLCHLHRDGSGRAGSGGSDFHFGYDILRFVVPHIISRDDTEAIVCARLAGHIHFRAGNVSGHELRFAAILEGEHIERGDARGTVLAFERNGNLPVALFQPGDTRGRIVGIDGIGVRIGSDGRIDIEHDSSLVADARLGDQCLLVVDGEGHESLAVAVVVVGHEEAQVRIIDLIAVLVE